MEQLRPAVSRLLWLGLARGSPDHLVQQLPDQPEGIDLVVVLARRKGQQLGLEGFPPWRVPQQVLAMRRRQQGATVAQIMAATGQVLSRRCRGSSRPP
jgi:hypothetical protein